MKKNVGISDRALRLVLSVGVFVLAYIHMLPGSWNIITWCVGGILLLTAAFGLCPLYSVFGVNTRKSGTADASRGRGASGTAGTAKPKIS